MIHQNHRHLICLILESVRQWIQLQLSLLPVPVLLKMTLTRKSRRKWQCRFSIRFANLAMLNTYWNRKDKAFSSCQYQKYWPQAIPVRMIQIKMQWHSIIWRFHIIWWMKVRVAQTLVSEKLVQKLRTFANVINQNAAHILMHWRMNWKIPSEFTLSKYAIKMFLSKE